MAATKFFKNAFAVSGDKTIIPNNVQPSGSVSYAAGFTFNYTLKVGTDPGALSFPRFQFNELMFDITSNLQQYQTYGVPNFISTSDNDGTAYPYPKYAMALYDDGVNGARPYQSKVDNNTVLPTNAANWQLLDNLQRAIIYDNATFESTVVDKDAVYWDAANAQFDKAVADGTERQNVLGIADVTNGRVYALGIVSLFTTLTPGSVYYLSATTPGQIVTSLSSSSVIQIGTAQTASTLLLAISSIPIAGLSSVLYTANDTFIVPSGVTEVLVTLSGGGGGGGGSNGSTYGSGGGGADSKISQLVTGLTPGNSVVITVGTGGTAGPTNTNGSAGLPSSFGSFVSASGGAGGGGGSSPGGGVPGGSGGAQGGGGNTSGPGAGGGSIFAAVTGTGNAAATLGGYGAGGNGASALNSAGTAGRNGFILVEW